MPAGAPITVREKCPRCGYSLHGTVVAWTDVCPLEGVCSECGLEFHWGDLLNPHRVMPRWCVEFAQPRAMALAWSIMCTLFMMLRPRRFWRDLKMVHPIRWRRLAILLLVMLPLWYVIFAVSVGVVAYQIAQAASSPSPWSSSAQAALRPWSALTISGTRVLSTHPSLAQRYHPMRLVWMLWRTVSSSTQDPTGDWYAIGKAASTLIAISILCPLGFLLLPMSRRVARVRWRHVARIAAYSLIILAIPVTVDCYDQIRGGMTSPYSWPPTSLSATPQVALAVLLTTSALLAIWWSMATRHYLRMRHAWAVGVFVVVFAFLFQRFALQAIDLALDLVQ